MSVFGPLEVVAANPVTESSLRHDLISEMPLADAACPVVVGQPAGRSGRVHSWAQSRAGSAIGLSGIEGGERVSARSTKRPVPCGGGPLLIRKQRLSFAGKVSWGQLRRSSGVLSQVHHCVEPCR